MTEKISGPDACGMYCNVMERKVMKKSKGKKGNGGFSLVELIIVIAIMAVLVGVLAPQYLSYIHKAKVAADQANLKNYYTEIQLDYASTGVYNPQVPLVDNIGEGGYELRDTLKLRDCNNFLAVGQYAWYYHPAVKPSHFLIPGEAGRMTLF